MEFHQKLVLKKDGNKQHVYYENNNKKVYRELNDESFKNLFIRFKPNTDFSFPDKLIQHFVKDGTMLPSFKSSMNYNEEDLENVTHDLDKQFKLIRNKLMSKSEKKQQRLQNKRPTTRFTRKKDNKKIKEAKRNENKRKLLEAINVKPKASAAKNKKAKGKTQKNQKKNQKKPKKD